MCPGLRCAEAIIIPAGFLVFHRSQNHGMRLTVPAVSHLQSLALMQIIEQRDLPVQIYAASIQADDLVPVLHPGRFCRISRSYVNHRAVVSQTGHQKHRQHKTQQEIKNRPCRHYGDPRPHRFASERTFFAALFIFPYHHTGTAEGKKLQRIPGASPFMAQQPGSHTHRKFCHRDSIPFCK